MQWGRKPGRFMADVSCFGAGPILGLLQRESEGKTSFLKGFVLYVDEPQLLEGAGLQQWVVLAHATYIAILRSCQVDRS